MVFLGLSGKWLVTAVKYRIRIPSQYWRLYTYKPFEAEEERVKKDSRRVEVKRKHLGKARRALYLGGKPFVRRYPGNAARPSDKDRLVFIIFKNPVHTLKQTQDFTITKIKLSMLFKEMIAVYENPIEPINTKYRLTDC
jgi:hypothetical protein